jgi:hypothetical protein
LPLEQHHKIWGEKPTGYSRTGCLNMAISNVFPHNVTTFGPFFPKHKAFVCFPLTFFFFLNYLFIIILLGCESSPKTKHCSTFFLFFGDEVSPFWKMNIVSQIPFFEK